MANKKLWLGILVLVLIFGMMVVGCWDWEEKSCIDSTSMDGKPCHIDPGSGYISCGRNFCSVESTLRKYGTTVSATCNCR